MWGPYPDNYKGLGTSILPKPDEPTRPYGWRERRGKDCGDEMMTKQAMKDDCDINLIVRRHAQTGLWNHLNPRQPSYGDFTGAQELQHAIAMVGQAEQDFYELPAEVRALCDNDPAVFLREVNNPESIRELAAAGLPMADGWEDGAADEVQQGGETPPVEGEGEGVT